MKAVIEYKGRQVLQLLCTIFAE